MLGVNLPDSGGMSSTSGGPQSPWPGRLVSAAVVLLVAALAAATFVLSYTGVRDLAVAAGVAPRFARLYPAILDGVLVVACAAAFMLRDGSFWRRLYAWFAVALLVGVVGAADAIHAMNVALPKRPAAGTVAALPWALVMLGFSLWLTMLRHARSHQDAPEPRVVPPVAVPALALPPAPPARRQTVTDELPTFVPGFDRSAPIVDESSEDEAAPEDDAVVDVDVEFGESLETAPAEAAEAEAEAEAEDPDSSPDGAADSAPVIAPQFYRVRSTPLPPEE